MHPLAGQRLEDRPGQGEIREETLPTPAPHQVLAITQLTNKRALLAGASGQPGEVRTYASREEAAAAIMAETRAGDVVLFENDLPDNYP